MNVRFPGGVPLVETTKRDRGVLSQAMGLCRHAGLIPGNEELAKAAEAIKKFVDEQTPDEDAE